MAGEVFYMAPVDRASGKVLGKKQKWTAVNRSWGNRQRGCAMSTERNYKLNPLSQEEVDARANFSTAAGVRKQIMNSAVKREQYRTQWKEEKKKGTTKCSTFNGWLTQKIMAGDITSAE